MLLAPSPQLYMRIRKLVSPGCLFCINSVTGCIGGKSAVSYSGSLSTVAGVVFPGSTAAPWLGTARIQFESTASIRNPIALPHDCRSQSCFTWRPTYHELLSMLPEAPGPVYGLLQGVLWTAA